MLDEEEAKRKQEKRELIEQIMYIKTEGPSGWEKIKELQLKVLELDPFDTRSMWDLARIAKKQKNYKDLKRWQTKVLEFEPDNIPAMFDLIKVAQLEKDWEEVKRLANRISELQPNNPKIYNIIRDANRNQLESDMQAFQQESPTHESETSAGMSEFYHEDRIFIKDRRIAELRHQLYSGDIKIEDLADLTEKFKDTLEGRLFIAELCDYFQQPKLALQALKGYQKEHQEDISEKDTKAIKQAFELIRSKKKILSNHKWLKVYSERTKPDGKDVER